MRITTEGGVAVAHPENKVEKSIYQKAIYWDELMDFVNERFLENGDLPAMEIEEYCKAQKYDKLKKTLADLMRRKEYKESEEVQRFVADLKTKIY